MKKRLLKSIILMISVMMLSACGAKDVETQDALKESAIAALENGKYDEALSEFDEALTYAGGRVTAREIDICYYKAVAQYLSENFSEAVKTLDGVIAYDEENADAYFLRGSIYLSEGESEKAIADFRKSVETSPGDNERVERIFEALCENGQREGGLSIVSEALAKMGDSDDELLWKGRLYILLEQYDDALDMLTRAEGAGIGEAEVYLAQVLAATGDKTGASEKLAIYMSSDTVTTDGIAAAGEEYMRLGEYEIAYDCFTQGIGYYSEEDSKRDDLTREAYRRLLGDRVAACEFLGQWSDALKYAREYIALYPQDERMLKEIKFLSTR